MKRAFAIFLVLTLSLLAGCAAQKPITPIIPPVNQDWTIDVTWQYDFTNFPQCSATVTTSCVNGFIWGFNIGNVKQPPVRTVPLSSFVNCPATLPSPADITCQQAPPSGSTQTTFFDFAHSLLPIGGTGAQIYNTASGMDMNGVAVVSVDATGNTIVTQLQTVTHTSFSVH